MRNGVLCCWSRELEQVSVEEREEMIEEVAISMTQEGGVRNCSGSICAIAIGWCEHFGVPFLMMTMPGGSYTVLRTDGWTTAAAAPEGSLARPPGLGRPA